MAEPQKPQLLSAFNTEAITSLNGAIDPESVSAVSKEFLVRAQQYPTLRMLLDAKDIKQKIGEALVKNNPEALRNILLDIFSEAKSFERQEMTELPGAEPFTGETTAAAPKLSTQEYVARITEAENASQMVIEQRKTAKRHEFAQRLAENFVKQTRRGISEEQRRAEIAMETHRIEQGLSSTDWYNNKEQIANTVGQSFFGGPTKQNVVDRTTKVAIAEADRVARDEERFEAVITAAASSVATDGVVVKRPDVYIKIVAHQTERLTKAPAAQIVDRAATLENATVGFTGNEEELPLQLSAVAKTPVQKFVAGVVDALPEGPREAIVAGVVGGAWEKAVDTATRYYGQQVVNEGWFQQALAHGDQGLSTTKNALQSITSGAQRVIGDVAVTVLRGRMDEATIGYLETIRQHAAVPIMASAVLRGPAGEITISPTETRRPVTPAAPAGGVEITQTETVRQYIVTMGPATYQRFYTAAVYAHNPGLLSYGLSLGIQYGTRKATRALIKAGVKKAAGKAAVSAAVKVGVEAAAGTATGGIATLVMIGADLLKGLITKGAAVLKSLLFMENSGRPEDSLILVLLGGLVLVFFLPLFPLLNIPAFNQSMIDTSLATSVISTGGQVIPSPPINPTPGPPIGPPTNTCANINGIYLSQSNPAWGNHTYGCPPCTIANSACGPTSDTMILNAFGVQPPATVDQVVNKIVTDNHYCGYCASDVSANLSLLAEHLTVHAGGFTSCAEATNVLNACGLIFAWGNHVDGNIPHFLVITGISCDATDHAVSYSTLDPAWGPGTQDPSTFTIYEMYGVTNK